MSLGALPPSLAAPLPGPKSAEWVEILARTESPAFTTRRARRSERAGAPHDPIVWAEAKGCNVVDADGNVFVDLTAGFGVATMGHAHPKIVDAIGRQSQRLLHALGDLHPSDVKVALLERLADLAPFEEARVALCLSGADAVETALMSAVLHTGRPAVLAFTGGYHGLSHGPLAVSGYRDDFRAPFSAQLNPHVTFAPFPDGETTTADAIAAIDGAWSENIGAVIVEPIQGRGGVRVPPDGFLRALGDYARNQGAVVIADEILTGLGRTGALFRSVHEELVPDLLCLGKSLGGGLPVSACIGRGAVMASWGDPDGAAIHTGTFFGHPLGAAAALASLEVLQEEALGACAETIGAVLLDGLRRLEHPAIRNVRGAGLMIGMEFDNGARVLRLVQRLLQAGYLTLPAGAHAEVLQLAPPLILPETLARGFVRTLDELLRSEAQ
ncbi:MAG: aminotransferase class III-fold pyridoxal phosphate-dependent enzyme [Myxococcota bacterium]